MNTFLIFLIGASIIVGLAYIFVVIIPLIGILTGTGKAYYLIRKQGELKKVNYCEDLGWTMADGGPAPEDDSTELARKKEE